MAFLLLKLMLHESATSYKVRNMGREAKIKSWLRAFERYRRILDPHMLCYIFDFLIPNP